MSNKIDEKNSQVNLSGCFLKHISYYDEENDDFIEAIGFKNEQDTWDIFWEFCSEEETLLFTVKTRTEAKEKFEQFVEEVILKRKKD